MKLIFKLNITFCPSSQFEFKFSDIDYFKLNVEVDDHLVFPFDEVRVA